LVPNIDYQEGTPGYYGTIKLTHHQSTFSIVL